MKRKIDSLVALVGAVLCVCACLVGCERKAAVSPEPPAPAMTNAPKKVVARADDAAYQAQLRGAVDEQVRKAKSLARVQSRLREVEARARAALPAGATPEQVKAELEENPQKYPAYRELVRAQAAVKAAARDFSKAQEMIRAHHMQRNSAGTRAQGAGTASN